MIQKKICMVGVSATGKTSLVRQFVESKFSEKYHSTVGVKIDRKRVVVAGDEVNLLLWDLEGKDGIRDIRTSYLRGASGILFVVDGTRRDTFGDVFSLREVTQTTLGDVPSLVAMNKCDLTDAWVLEDRDYATLQAADWHAVRTSAKTGEGVEEAFLWLAERML